MRKQKITFELDEELSKTTQDKILDLLKEEKAKNIDMDYEEVK